MQFLDLRSWLQYHSDGAMAIVITATLIDLCLNNAQTFTKVFLLCKFLLERSVGTYAAMTIYYPK